MRDLNKKNREFLKKYSKENLGQKTTIKKIICKKTLTEIKSK